MHVRPAGAADCPRLCEIALAAKRHWGYPEAWIELWRDELAVTPEYVEHHTVLAACVDGRLVGCAGAGFDDGRWWLDHMWVDPGAMGRGVGGALLDGIVEKLVAAGAPRLVIISDPNAEGFYRRLGAVCTGEVPSTPPGRTLPVYELELSADSC